MNHEERLAKALAEADKAHSGAVDVVDAEHSKAQQRIGEELDKALARCDKLTEAATDARQSALEAAAAARADAVSVANRKFDDAMRSELGLEVEVREQGGVLFLIDPANQLTVATATPSHGGHVRIIGPRGDIVMVAKDRARPALWLSAKPVLLPVPA